MVTLVGMLEALSTSGCEMVLRSKLYSFQIDLPSIVLSEFRQLTNLHHFRICQSRHFQSFTIGTQIADANPASLALKSGQMLKIQRATNKQVVFTLSGQMDAENVAELKALIELEVRGRHIVLELRDLTLVDRDAAKFLERCETNSIKLENC
jgi:hypothetical protein